MNLLFIGLVAYVALIILPIFCAFYRARIADENESGDWTPERPMRRVISQTSA